MNTMIFTLQVLKQRLNNIDTSAFVTEILNDDLAAESQSVTCDLITEQLDDLRDNVSAAYSIIEMILDNVVSSEVPKHRC